MLFHLLNSLKAIAALVGTVLTALVGILTPDDPGYRILVIALAVATAVATWTIPNLEPDEGIGSDDDFEDVPLEDELEYEWAEE